MTSTRSMHRRSGHNGKSPKLRMSERLAAEKDERKARKSACKYSSVAEAMEAENG